MKCTIKNVVMVAVFLLGAVMADVAEVESKEVGAVMAEAAEVESKEVTKGLRGQDSEGRNRKLGDRPTIARQQQPADGAPQGIAPPGHDMPPGAMIEGGTPEPEPVPASLVSEDDAVDGCRCMCEAKHGRPGMRMMSIMTEGEWEYGKTFCLRDDAILEYKWAGKAFCDNKSCDPLIAASICRNHPSWCKNKMQNSARQGNPPPDVDIPAPLEPKPVPASLVSEADAVDGCRCKCKAKNGRDGMRMMSTMTPGKWEYGQTFCLRDDAILEYTMAGKAFCDNESCDPIIVADICARGNHASWCN